MPYNNTPIAPSNEVSGQVSLPLARVQKIISADPDHLHVSKNASFAIALATEMFIQHLATTTHNVVKAERKPRRNLQYRDVSSAVAKTDNLEFLVDVVPKTVTYKEFKKRKEEKEMAKKDKVVVNGVRAVGGGVVVGVGEGKANGLVQNGELNGHVDVNDETEKAEEEQGTEDVDMDVDEKPVEPTPTPAPAPAQPTPDEDDEDGAAMQIEMEMRGPRRNGASASASPVQQRRTSGFTAINGTRS
ncbi:hypothetical protein BDV96DRAFT_564682 [Lophiotrema nucula]|uniref:Transcription factor CBF/NF-Y/archaeal histone domain-containing protein n=1 Tax=Lophiotrema nucula TaxID=690887 RepID=A0A6A5ZTV5_9PLEO|nr:hypothetical protein BDV96DRAFT_564682 [Lophiotrema nucula]